MVIYKVVVAYEKWSLWQIVLKNGFYQQHIQFLKYGSVFQQTCSNNWIKISTFTQFRPGTALFLLNYLLREHSKFSENLENLPNKINLQTIQDILFFSEFLFTWKLSSCLNLRKDQFPNNLQYLETYHELLAMWQHYWVHHQHCFQLGNNNCLHLCNEMVGNSTLAWSAVQAQIHLYTTDMWQVAPGLQLWGLVRGIHQEQCRIEDDVW